jgi:hypothetical protein
MFSDEYRFGARYVQGAEFRWGHHARSLSAILYRIVTLPCLRVSLITATWGAEVETAGSGFSPLAAL